MPDRIDPGPGWRLLNPEEIVEYGDQLFLDGMWRIPRNAGTTQCFTCPYRRRIPKPRTIKAVATRATVKAAFPDGAMTSDSIACKTGLSGEMMQYVSDRWNLASKHLPTSGARYIMLEIYREGEP